MLSQRSLKPSSFLFILLSFVYLAAVISTTLSSSMLISSSVSFSLLLIPSRIFFTSVIVFFISVWMSFIFFNFSLKKNFSLCASIFLLGSLIIFIITTLNSFSGRLPISTLVSYSYGVLSYLFETRSFVASFYLDCCLYFYVSGRLVMLSDFGEAALCRRHHMCPSNTSPSHHPSDML